MKAMGTPTLIGIPFDGQSSYLRGAGDAPAKIREALACESSNMWAEVGVDLGRPRMYEDAGDLALSEKEAFLKFEAGIGRLLAIRKRPVVFGGDHSITFPIVKAFSRKYPELTIFPLYIQPDLSVE